MTSYYDSIELLDYCNSIDSLDLLERPHISDEGKRALVSATRGSTSDKKDDGSASEHQKDEQESQSDEKDEVNPVRSLKRSRSSSVSSEYELPLLDHNDEDVNFINNAMLLTQNSIFSDPATTKITNSLMNNNNTTNNAKYQSNVLGNNSTLNNVNNSGIFNSNNNLSSIKGDFFTKTGKLKKSKRNQQHLLAQVQPDYVPFSLEQVNSVNYYNFSTTNESVNYVTRVLVDSIVSQGVHGLDMAQLAQSGYVADRSQSVPKQQQQQQQQQLSGASGTEVAIRIYNRRIQLEDIQRYELRRLEELEKRKVAEEAERKRVQEEAEKEEARKREQQKDAVNDSSSVPNVNNNDVVNGVSNGVTGSSDNQNPNAKTGALNDSQPVIRPQPQQHPHHSQQQQQYLQNAVTNHVNNTINAANFSQAQNPVAKNPFSAQTFNPQLSQTNKPAIQPQPFTKPQTQAKNQSAFNDASFPPLTVQNYTEALTNLLKNKNLNLPELSPLQIEAIARNPTFQNNQIITNFLRLSMRNGAKNSAAAGNVSGGNTQSEQKQ